MTKTTMTKKTVTKKTVPKVVESSKFAPLAKLTKKQMRYVQSPFHHAYMTEFQLTPSDDYTHEDHDMDDAEIDYFVKKYGVPAPPKHEYDYEEDTYIHYF
jgi:hypothetical protein